MTEKEIQQLDLQTTTEDMDKHYSDTKFLNKLKKTGGKLAEKAIYASLVLFYALQSPEVPKKSRMLILGALGYFIFPVDLLPDFLPAVGFTDDAFIIIAAFGKLIGAINEETKEKARKRMEKWFGKPNKSIYVE
ncbi:MAG TPA: YkvA family protein [Bacillaceae bacterium]|nr:YkvA family protein [Paenibacillus bovis]HLU23369.1 YkvA family protein [Bacillaceae bacterium]